MPPQIALLAVCVFVLGALFVDARRPPHTSLALWLPTLWGALLLSRPLSNWLAPAVTTLGEATEEGSPLDRALLSFMLASAFFILARRKLPWAEWFRKNSWFVLFLLYCAVSLVWSDFPGIGVKRWIRAVGAVMMILIVLSEHDPLTALATVIRRCAFVLVPFSVLVIKYFRNYGVVYDYWTGSEIIVGVATDKNALGRLCLIAGLFGVWEIVTAKNNPHLHQDKLNRLARFAMLLLTFWLLAISNSKTSLVSILMGSFVLVALGLPILRTRTRYLGSLVLVSVITVVTLDQSLGLAASAAASLGRDLTLTDRTFVWAALLNMHTNPLLGVGYDTFWLGRRLDMFVTKFNVMSAHNGYLEIYLELGFIGLFLFVCFLLSVFSKAKSTLAESFEYERLRIVMLFTFMMYNMTESGYRPTTAIFWLFLLVALEFPRVQATVAAVRPAAALSARPSRVPPPFAPERTRGVAATWRPRPLSTSQPSATTPGRKQGARG